MCFPFHLQDAMHFTLCSFEADVSVRLLGGVGITPGLPPPSPLTGDGGWLSHFWPHPLRPLLRAAPLETVWSAPLSHIIIPKMAQCCWAIPWL